LSQTWICHRHTFIHKNQANYIVMDALFPNSANTDTLCTPNQPQLDARIRYRGATIYGEPLQMLRATVHTLAYGQKQPPC